MPARSELLGKPSDFLDDITYCLTYDFRSPYGPDSDNGNFLAKDYERVLKLSTEPVALDEHQLFYLNRSIGRLNQNYVHMQPVLQKEGLAETYTSIAQQVNAINLANGNADNVPLMFPVAERENVVQVPTNS